MKHTVCPCCSSSDLENFFTIPNAPTQSLVTIRNREEAQAIARQDIVLTFCNDCGFIFNSAFDTSIDYFTQGYEDQQGFSQNRLPVPVWDGCEQVGIGIGY